MFPSRMHIQASVVGLVVVVVVVVVDVSSPPLADYPDRKVLEAGRTLKVSVECSKLSPTLRST